MAKPIRLRIVKGRSYPNLPPDTPLVPGLRPKETKYITTAIGFTADLYGDEDEDLRRLRKGIRDK